MIFLLEVKIIFNVDMIVKILKGDIFFMWLIFKICFFKCFCFLVIVILNWDLSWFLMILSFFWFFGINEVIVGEVWVLFFINNFNLSVFSVVFKVLCILKWCEIMWFNFFFFISFI